MPYARSRLFLLVGVIHETDILDETALGDHAFPFGKPFGSVQVISETGCAVRGRCLRCGVVGQNEGNDQSECNGYAAFDDEQLEGGVLVPTEGSIEVGLPISSLGCHERLPYRSGYRQQEDRRALGPACFLR